MRAHTHFSLINVGVLMAERRGFMPLHNTLVCQLNNIFSGIRTWQSYVVILSFYLSTFTTEYITDLNHHF